MSDRKYTLFDTHAHYDDERFDEDRYDVISSARESGVEYFVNVGSSMDSSKRSICLANEFDFMYATVGIHPHNVGEADDTTTQTIIEWASDPKVVAIGEIGLDYYYDHAPRELQKQWFVRQINIAKELKLPIIIHDRDAHEDVMNIVKSEDAGVVGGIFHCYSGSVEMAKEVLKNNFYISIAGPATFKNARKLVEVIEYVPMDKILVETDCPYLAPEPYRGKRNDSGYMYFVAQKIAEIKGISIEEVANTTTQNAKRVFGV